MSQAGRVIVFGGRGALGAKCVSHFKANKYWVGCIDLAENAEADCNIIVNKEESFQQQETSILSSVKTVLDGSKVDGIFCVAGGWAGGNAKKDLAKTSDLMWQQSVCSSLITAAIAAHHLKEGGIVQLTGAKAALDATPGMIGYGLGKAAVHQLTKSLAQKESGLPEGASVVAILPVTLDTPMNRKWMPKADFSSWTPLEFIAELFLKWASGDGRPQSGSLLQLVTNNFNTELIPA
ncbi:dihydropteridine reductase [Anoplophora glabripennis]|uniref:Dihydropteridine reductase n=1 Tax=Anoplophora glabripennis TaxID=217634 RepID=V5H0N1_ANOGL|nr:dihydropteridine reductase [Anoplophora glabripennis]XP_018578338.1 dihydropteridine reductase [Anoplophora glabripennis]